MEKTIFLRSPKLCTLVARSGISPHLYGYTTICIAVALMVEYGIGKCKLVSDLYPRIAEMLGTTPYSVERNIRTAINFAWSGGSLKHFYEGIGLHIDKRPSNSAFISQLANILLTESAHKGSIKVTWE